LSKLRLQTIPAVSPAVSGPTEGVCVNPVKLRKEVSALLLYYIIIVLFFIANINSNIVYLSGNRLSLIETFMRN